MCVWGGGGVRGLCLEKAISVQQRALIEKGISGWVGRAHGCMVASLPPILVPKKELFLPRGSCNFGSGKVATFAERRGNIIAEIFRLGDHKENIFRDIF